MNMVYHYTNVSSLAYILKNRTIRLNCLKNVDDMNECSTRDNKKISNYVFASSWTRQRQENIALWVMYTNKLAGIRIGMPENLLDIDLDENSIVKNAQLSGNNRIEDYLIYGHAGYNPVPIDYRPSDEVRKFMQITKSENGKQVNLNSSYLGLVKDEQWSFQKESRFVVMAVKKKDDSLKLLSGRIPNMYLPLLREDPISLDYIDLPIKIEAINQMEILLGPNCNDCDQIITESLLYQFLPSANINVRKSELKIRSRH